MTKLRLTWLGIMLLILGACFAGAAFISGPVGVRVFVSAVGVFGLVAGWRCVAVAARLPRDPWVASERPWER